jgi:hypothetical protein
MPSPYFGTLKPSACAELADMSNTLPPASLAPLHRDWADTSPFLNKLLEDPTILSRHAAPRDTFKAAAAEACSAPPLNLLLPFVAEVAARTPALGAAPPPLSFLPPSARARPIKTASNLQVPPKAFAH